MAFPTIANQGEQLFDSRRRDEFGSLHYQGGAILYFEEIKGLTNPKCFGDGKRFFFPVGPIDNFRVGSSYEHSEFMPLRGGQRSHAAGVSLKTVNFNTVFLDYVPDWATWRGGGFGRGPNPKTVMIQQRVLPIRRLLNSGTPFTFKMLNPWTNSYEVNDAFTLRTFDSEERAGEMDARYVELSLVEFRLSKVTAQAAGEGRGRAGGDTNRGDRGGGSEGRHVYLGITGGILGVTAPVTFAKLATSYCGTVTKWREIRDLNPDMKALSQSDSINQFIANHKRQYSQGIAKVKLPPEGS